MNHASSAGEAGHLRHRAGEEGRGRESHGGQSIGRFSARLVTGVHKQLYEMEEGGPWAFIKTRTSLLCCATIGLPSDNRYTRTDIGNSKAAYDVPAKTMAQLNRPKFLRLGTASNCPIVTVITPHHPRHIGCLPISRLLVNDRPSSPFTFCRPHFAPAAENRSAESAEMWMPPPKPS